MNVFASDEAMKKCAILLDERKKRGITDQMPPMYFINSSSGKTHCVTKDELHHPALRFKL